MFLYSSTNLPIAKKKISGHRCQPVEYPKEFEPPAFDVTGSHQLHTPSMLAHQPINGP